MGQEETEKEGVSESKDMEKVLQNQNLILNIWKRGSDEVKREV